jgi:hypothetical protein
VTRAVLVLALLGACALEGDPPPLPDAGAEELDAQPDAGETAKETLARACAACGFDLFCQADVICPTAEPGYHFAYYCDDRLISGTCY